VDAVVFDLYGTLIRLERDTRPYVRFARRVRPDDPGGVVRRSLVVDAHDLRRFAERLGVDPPEGVEALEDDLRRDVRSARVFEDVEGVLADLRGRGVRLGLISNAATPYKEPFERLGLAGRFDAVLFSCDAGLRKPEPEIYRRMADALGVEPARVVMVGDGPRSDVEGPRGVGMGARLLRRGGGGGIAGLGELAASIGVTPGR